MPKNQAIPFDSQTDASMGEINITTGVLESIATKAASEVDGVATNLARLDAAKFLKFERSGIVTKVRRENNRLAIDVSVSIQYGKSVPEVALAIQDRVKEQILFMTDLVVNEVNVHILSIETESTEDQSFLQLDEENSAIQGV